MILLYLLTQLFTLFSIASAASDDDKSTCAGPNTHQYECECLRFVFEPQTSWTSAENACQQWKDGSMLTIRSAAKMEFVRDILKRQSSKQGVWLGAQRDDSNNFRWVDNNKLVSSGYTSWTSREPDNFLGSQGCIIMHSSDLWDWKDFFCGPEPYSYVCQYEMTSCPGDPDDFGSGLTTPIIIGIVIGGIIGLILFFALLFLVINCIRKAVSYHKKPHHRPSSSTTGRPIVSMREIEERQGGLPEENLIPPPEYAGVSQPPPPEYYSLQQDPDNDLDILTSKKSSLLRAPNLPVQEDYEVTVEEGGGKISNLSQPPSAASGSKPSSAAVREARGDTDNYLSQNQNTDDTKQFISSVPDVNKL